MAHLFFPDLKPFADYLNNQEHYVAKQRQTSEKRNIKTGVPQGSIFGPLLFIDQPKQTEHSEITLFADDNSG